MSPILAGIVSGALMGLIFDLLTLQAMLKLRKDAPPWLQNVLNQVSFFRLVGPMALFTHSGWTFAGLAAGTLYAVTDGDSPSSGLGSPFLGFTLGVLVLAFFYLMATAMAGGRIRGWMMPSPVVFAITFGWVLPLLSD
ncbi:MAG: hypothetical protein VYB71_00885 [Chloroflexota bacterium]|nr:hypothetical protein [Chloroflexota bacterium]